MTWTPEELAELPNERLSAMVRDGEVSPNDARRASARQRIRNVNKPGIDGFEFKIARLDLRPGDILVVKVAAPLPTETRKRLSDYVAAATGHPAMILDGGADLAVLTAAEIAARTAAPPQSEDAS